LLFQNKKTAFSVKIFRKGGFFGEKRFRLLLFAK
jgi:hypothetical protein